MIKFYKKQTFLTALLLMISLITFAQAQVTGVIKDAENGQPLPGVVVKLKGTTSAVSSNADGKFSITAPGDGVLSCSFLGYNTKDVSIGGKTNIAITLSASTKGLNEVVVVGYGTQKKVNVSGAVNTVSAKQLTNRPVTSLTSALEGVVPGMTIVGRPGDAGGKTKAGSLGGDDVSINVRGRGNLGTSSPLFVVDGVPITGGDFSRINPNDVESISVLKDASASSIYGSRAAYGVILVTTKKGKDGQAVINYNAYYGIQTPTVLPKWLGSYDFATLTNEALSNAGKTPRFSASDLQKIKDHSDPDNFPDNDWYKLTLRQSAPMTEHEINISGGGKTRYFLGGSFFDQNSLLPDKNLQRYSFRANTESQVSDKFRIGSNVSFIRDGLDNKNGTVDFTTLNREVPLMVNKQSNGEWGSIDGGLPDGTLAAGNPLRTLAEGGRNSYTTNRFIGSVNGNYTPIKGLDINGMVSYNYFSAVSSAFTSTIDPILNFNTGAPISGTGVSPNQLDEAWENTGKLLTQGTVSYEKTVGKHYAKLLGGASYEQYSDRKIEVIRKNFASNDLNSINAGSADPLNTASTGGIQNNAIESVFGRFNYSYNDRYLLEASMRVDASSQFAPGHRSGAYPSFSGAWRISQEDFMKSVTWLSELKLRGSWGKLGNISNVGNYDFYDGINTGTAVILDQSKQDGAWQGKLPNTTLSWEKITMTNVGLDAGFFNNKLNLQVDAFNKITNGILLTNPSLPDEAGLVFSTDPAKNTAPSANLAKVQNKGFELSLNYNGHIQDFKFSVGGNVSRIWNKVLNLGGQGDQVNGYYVNRVGAAIGSFYMWQADGLFTSSADVANHATQSTSTKAGDIKYVDQNGDGKIDGNDRVIVGNDVPYFTYGVNLSASYKNFDFSLLGQGVGNVKVYLEEEASQAFFNGAGVKEYVLGRWTATNPNPNAVYPRLLSSADNTQNLKQSSFWLFNADYFRVKALTIGYSLPKKVLESIHIKGLRVYASSNNPFTIRGDKRLKDFDPETASQRSSYPQLKTYSFGVNLTL
ncbi:MAG: SusC/RagA family TonB-linked outer membrane protein [Mucilaginibacter sp.]|nr:SusC/RagA family TonB-linked outer membrane protein [Mucilaginibacter sp.]